MKSDLFILGALIFVALASILLTSVTADDTGDSYEMLVDGMTNPVSNSYFAETGWRPVEEWEIERCSKKLSSDLEGSISGDKSFSDQNFNYGTSATLQAMYKDNYGDFYHELAWYLQPTTKDITFSLVVKCPSGDIEIVEPTKMGQNEGRGFYHAFVELDKCSEAILDFGEGKLITEFVEKEE